MKTGLLLSASLLMFAGPAMAQSAASSQNKQDNLPSAPSATVQEQNNAQDKQDSPQPQPAPDPAPAETKPVFKNLSAPRKTQPAPAQTSQASPAKDATAQANDGADKPANTNPNQPAPVDSLAPPSDKEMESKAAQTKSSTKVANSTPSTIDAAPGNPEETVVKTVNEVRVVFTVTDKHGAFIKGLDQKDFSVLDDNRPPVSIGSFSAQTDLPLRVGLLIDASSSIREQFRFEQEAAVEFLNSIIRQRTDKAFVIGFDTTPELVGTTKEQPLSNDLEALNRGVRSIKPSGGTALYDALYYASRDILLKHQENVPVRRAIILISDGDDNQSRVTREEAIEMAQRAEVIVYTISTNLNNMLDRGDKMLERIADATGGRPFRPFKIQDVANAFTDIQAELRSQYAISYKPAELIADGRYHAIDISALNKRNKVRARKGYFAPKK